MSLLARDSEPFDMDRDESCFGPRLLMLSLTRQRARDIWVMTSMRVIFVQDVGWKLGERVRLDGKEEAWKEGEGGEAIYKKEEVAGE
jgi:hypothetical protein